MKLWNRLEQWVKRRALSGLEGIFERKLLDPHLINLAAIRSILVIRQHDQLGDFLLATPVLRALREHFPQAHLAVLARGYTAEIVQHLHYLDEVLVFQEYGWNWTLPRFWRLLKGLRRRRELTIVLNTVSHSLTSDLLAVLSRPRYLLGSSHRVFPGCRRNFFYNLEAPYRPGSRHQTERNLDIVRYLGLDTIDRSEAMALSPKDEMFARRFLRGRHVNEGDRLVMMHLGAGKIMNRWPVAKFAELAESLHREFDVRILAAWGPREAELGSDFVGRLTFTPIVVEKVSLRELAALIAHADGYVCNDTGVMHVGAAVGTPLVAIFGPTDPNEWKPLGEKIVALRGDENDCANVTLAQVRNALLGLIQPPLAPRLMPPEHEFTAAGALRNETVGDDAQISRPEGF